MAVIPTAVLAGPFTTNYTPPIGSGGGSLGVIGPEGIRFTREFNMEPITSDQYGRDTILDGVYTGGNLYLEFTLKEANKDLVRAMAYPFSGAPASTGAALYGAESEMGNPGQLISSASGVLILTAVAGTPAAAETTPTRTFSQVILAPGQRIDAFLRAGIKEYPIKLLCLPYIVSNKTVWFTRS